MECGSHRIISFWGHDLRWVDALTVGCLQLTACVGLGLGVGSRSAAIRGRMDRREVGVGGQGKRLAADCLLRAEAEFNVQALNRRSGSARKDDPTWTGRAVGTLPPVLCKRCG
jgi:hypothetical protein